MQGSAPTLNVDSALSGQLVSQPPSGAPGFRMVDLLRDPLTPAQEQHVQGSLYVSSALRNDDVGNRSAAADVVRGSLSYLSEPRGKCFRSCC